MRTKLATPGGKKPIKAHKKISVNRNKRNQTRKNKVILPKRISRNIKAKCLYLSVGNFQTCTNKSK